MKRFLIALSIIFIAVPSLAGHLQTAHKAVVGVVRGAGGSGDCADQGSWELYWDGTHSSGANYACIAGSGVSGTLGGTGSIVDPTSDPGTANFTSGVNVLKVTADGDSLTIPVTGGTDIDSTQGHIKLSFYYNLALITNIFSYTSGSDSIICSPLGGLYRVICSHTGNNGATSQTTYSNTTDLLSLDDVNVIEYRWDCTANTHGVKINGGSWEDDSEDIAPFNSEGSSVVLESSNVDPGSPDYAGELYIDTTYP